ncbi:uncharacterized protein EDB91DRAFT_207133 [Suillus paluster]|uniref:uncharacterized protein n=1 Tax=Suillus paluster TaxID=48578 RepID=UPI001B8671AA|nr:uncharacterized protein EDB91DRAFT_207133 [Suillus paluster]KAG1744008.1 hypothetical protein EDB91DRAFT_207133 [Suillus paluster]
MSEGTNDWIVADSEDEDGFQPLVVADQSVLLSGSPVSTKISQASVIQTASLISSPARTPRRAHNSLDISNVSLFTPPPGYQDSDPPNASPSLPRDAETFVPKSKPRPRPVPRKSRTTNTIYDDFVNEDASRASGSLIISASAITASTLAPDSIRAPTTPSIVSEHIEDVNHTFSIADRAKTRSRKTQAKKPTYVPVAHDVIELTSDSDLDELSLKPPWKRHKSQDKPVKPKPKPKPKTKPPKAKSKSPSPKLAGRAMTDTQSNDVVVLPVYQELALPSHLPSTASHLPSSLPPLPDLSSSPPSSPPVMARKRKRALPLEPDVQGEEMDLDIPHGPSSLIKDPPLFFAQSSPVVPPIDDSHPLEEEKGDTVVIATGGKGKKKDTKLSTRAKGKKKDRKQADEVELDDLVHKSSLDEAAAGNDGLAADDFVAEVPKATSKKKAPSKPKPATKNKSKPKGKGKTILSESENEDDDPPRAKSPRQCSHVPENELEESRGGNSTKDSRTIEDSATTKKNSPQSVAAPPKQAPSTGLKSRTFTIKSKSTPMSELIRRVNSQPNSPFANGPSYSPLMKSSRTMLSRIAPLHPNRRTPPPPLPRPPPPKKSKKQIEMEERIEEELLETVEGWSCMTDEERRNLRRARIDAELGYE